MADKQNSNKNKEDNKPKFVVKNYDETGKLIEDLSKVVLSLDLSRSIARIILDDSLGRSNNMKK